MRPKNHNLKQGSNQPPLNLAAWIFLSEQQLARRTAILNPNTGINPDTKDTGSLHPNKCRQTGSLTEACTVSLWDESQAESSVYNQMPGTHPLSEFLYKYSCLKISLTIQIVNFCR